MNRDPAAKAHVAIHRPGAIRIEISAGVWHVDDQANSGKGKLSRDHFRTKKMPRPKPGLAEEEFG